MNIVYSVSHIMKYFVILLVLIFTIAIIPNPVSASCSGNIDWIEVPCEDSQPYPGADQMMLDWHPYYDYKGREFMENKKLELVQTLDSGTISDWLGPTSSRYDVNDNENIDFSEKHNVFFYYYFMRAVPDSAGFIHETQNSPIEQFEYYKSMKEISCNYDYVVMKKSSNGLPACIKPDTYATLLERGWGTTPLVKSIKVYDSDLFVNYRIDDDAVITSIEKDEDANLVSLSIDTAATGYLTIELPRNLIDSKLTLCGETERDSKDDPYSVLMDGKEVYYVETETTPEFRTLLMSYPFTVTKIEIVSFCLI